MERDVETDLRRLLDTATPDWWGMTRSRSIRVVLAAVALTAYALGVATVWWG